ncbi:Spatacsin [Camelus dromedarius]|uniref:Spatacsin n=1 Tax=Camelus dromedarius TaxID=9838 RepID=A0A5N4E3K4_CAMDR|nr:Spatacsin [Camelus dromedarius]
MGETIPALLANASVEQGMREHGFGVDHRFLAVAIILKHRQYPGHLLCERSLEDVPVEGPEGIDEDDPVNSDYNMKLTKFSFQVDRSWKAQLSSLNESIKSSKLEASCCAPWFQDILHLESPESGDQSASVPSWAFIPQGLPHRQYSFPWKSPTKTRDPGRLWKRMHISEQEEPLELACVSVTGFTALFTWSVERTGCSIALWDLETQAMQCFSLGKKCIPVDSDGDQQLCLVLTGENVLRQVGIHRREHLSYLFYYCCPGDVEHGFGVDHRFLAVAIILKHRQYPGHLLCERSLEDVPVEGPEGIDEDDPVNSDYNMKLTKFSFQVDRSWKAQLSSLNESIKSSKLEASCCAPWFQDILHLESPESGDQSASVPSWAFIPQGLPHRQYSFPWKSPTKTRDPGRLWKRMHISEQEEPLELACVSVTGFTALFTWSVERTGCSIALWDLETQAMQCFSLGKKCIPVDSDGDQQLCLVLTENGLCLILFGLTQEEFLNRLMIHGSARTVDSLCHLNGWGLCSIPMHALEVTELNVWRILLDNPSVLYSDYRLL